MEELEALGSPIGAFVKDCCRTAPGAMVECDALYRKWVEWCKEQGRDHPGSLQTFGRDRRAVLPAIGTTHPAAKAGTRRIRYYTGVAVDDRGEKAVNRRGKFSRVAG